MKHLIALVLVGLCVIAASTLMKQYKEIQEIPDIIRGHIELAKSQEEKGLYLNALDYRAVVADEDPGNVENIYMIAEDTRQLGDWDKYIELAGEFLNQYGNNEQEKEHITSIYHILSEYYSQTEKPGELYRICIEGMQNQLIEKTEYEHLKAFYDGLESECSVGASGADYIGDFYHGYAVADFSSIGTEGKVLITTGFEKYSEEGQDAIILMGENNNLSIVKDSDNTVRAYLDKSVLKDFAVFDESVEEICDFSNSEFVVKTTKGYYSVILTDTSKEQIEPTVEFHEGWTDYACIGDDIAWVQENGIWKVDIFGSLVDLDEGEIEPVYNERGMVERTEEDNIISVFAKVSEGYKRVSYDKGTNSVSISKEVYEDARPFLRYSEPAAVRVGGQWKFIDGSGGEVLTPETSYEDARSFSGGYAAVKRNGKWTFINRLGREIFEPVFHEVGALYHDKVPVIDEDGVWKLARLQIKTYQ